MSELPNASAKESEPLLPLHHQPLSPSSSRLSGSRTPWREKPRRQMSEKTKGKQRAIHDIENEAGSELVDDGHQTYRSESPVQAGSEDEEGSGSSRMGKSVKPAKKAGRCVTIIFSGEEEGTSEGNLEIWVDDGESVGSVKDQVGCRFRVLRAVQRLRTTQRKYLKR